MQFSPQGFDHADRRTSGPADQRTSGLADYALNRLTSTPYFRTL